LAPGIIFSTGVERQHILLDEDCNAHTKFLAPQTPGQRVIAAGDATTYSLLTAMATFIVGFTFAMRHGKAQT